MKIDELVFPISLLIMTGMAFLHSAYGFQAGPFPFINVKISSHRAIVAQRKEIYSLAQRNMLKHGSSSSGGDQERSARQHNPKHSPGSGRQSHSVHKAANNYFDSLPEEVPTAHGLLCPFTVERMDAVTRHGEHDQVVRRFLDKYRLHGPMACVDMISDPDVLPHLTQAMKRALTSQ